MHFFVLQSNESVSDLLFPGFISIIDWNLLEILNKLIHLNSLLHEGVITMNNYKTKNKRKGHIRAESERKDMVKSIRCSENEFTKIQKNAKKAGMSFNNYLVTQGANGNKGLTPALMVEIQNHTNYACSVVEKYAPDEVATMQEGVNKLWQKLI